ncbi:MAG: HEPN domain-containing protein [Geminicoccaceae bacterium]
MSFALPFAVELALKALIEKQGNKASKTHDLTRLYNQLFKKKRQEVASELGWIEGVNGSFRIAECERGAGGRGDNLVPFSAARESYNTIASHL